MPCRVALILAFVGVSPLLTSCKTDPHNIVLESDDPGAIGTQLKEHPGLNDDELRLFMAAVMRSKMAAAFGGKETALKGQKVGELIDNQREIFANEAKQEAELKRQAAETKAKQDALAQQLRQTLPLTVVAKEFRPAKPMAGSFQSYITIKCMYQNNSDKPVRAFRGTVIFTDLFGEEIYKSRITVSDEVAAHASGSWIGSIEYNQFISEQNRFKNAALQDMKTIWSPSSIIFADGTQLGEKEAQASDGN